MMEIEFFVEPGEDEGWHERWIADCVAWYTSLGLDEGHLRLRPHDTDELSHYSKATTDIEYRFPWGWGEIQGIANRTDFDLRAHAEASGERLAYFDDEAHEHVVPYVIEPSAGVDRAVMAFLVDAYSEEESVGARGKPETRVVLKLHPTLAPVKGRRAPAEPKRAAHANGSRGPRRHSALGRNRRVRAVRRRPEHRPPLPPPGRGSARPCASP